MCNFIHFYTAKKIIIITRRNYLNIIIPNFNFNRPEYKIPGLYVIDSIVRQSRHQFGPDKDVFAPRFAKNIQLTFYHLYKCSEEEKVYISLVSFLIFLGRLLSCKSYSSDLLIFISYLAVASDSGVKFMAKE